MVRSTDDASRYVDDIMRGGNVSEFSLADDASPVATAALDDSSELSRLQKSLEEAPESTCDVIGVISDATVSEPHSTEILDFGDSQAGVYEDAKYMGVSEEVTRKVIEAAETMAQSTWVDAADGVCDAAEGL